MMRLIIYLGGGDLDEPFPKMYSPSITCVGDIMMHVWGYLEYRGGCSVPWGDIMIHVGNILSTVSMLSTMGDIMSTMGSYLEYREGYSVPWGML